MKKIQVTLFNDTKLEDLECLNSQSIVIDASEPKLFFLS